MAKLNKCKRCNKEILTQQPMLTFSSDETGQVFNPKSWADHKGYFCSFCGEFFCVDCEEPEYTNFENMSGYSICIISCPKCTDKHSAKMNRVANAEIKLYEVREKYGKVLEKLPLLYEEDYRTSDYDTVEDDDYD